MGQDFGMTPEVRCPYHDGKDGLCSIWPHRNAACATYFCRYVGGPAWRGFWWILNRTLAEVERTLSEWCRDRLDPEEGEFFVRCADLVRDLSWNQVLQICGPGGEAFARQVQEAQDGLLSQVVPGDLRPGTYRVVRSDPERRWILTEERFGPIRVSRGMLDCLPYFDGRSVGDAVRTIAEKEGIRIDDTLLHHLLGYGLLVPSMP